MKLKTKIRNLYERIFRRLTQHFNQLARCKDCPKPQDFVQK